MAWEQLSESDKAWIAGIYEGEGSIYVYKGSGERTKYKKDQFNEAINHANTNGGAY